MNLSKNVKVTKVSAAVATGTSTINTTTLDMQGYDGVMWLASLGSAASNNGIKAQQGQASGMGDAADLINTQVLSDGTQTDLVLDIYRPQERYVRCSVVRGTTTTIEAVWAVQYQGAKRPVNNATAAQAVETHVSPVEGTA
jgi:hypothetical protein